MYINIDPLKFNRKRVIFMKILYRRLYWKLAVCYYVPVSFLLFLKYIVTLWIIYNKPSIKCCWFFYSSGRLGFTTKKGRVFVLFIFFLMPYYFRISPPRHWTTCWVACPPNGRTMWSGSSSPGSWLQGLASSSMVAPSHSW